MTPRGIIIHDKKLVYWYLPKTCCTALKTYFANYLNLKIPFKNGNEMDIHGQNIGFEFTEKVIDGYYNFAYVRNPFDRIMSLYSQKIRDGVDRKVFPDESLFYKGMPFQLFVDRIIEIPEKERHYMLQSDMILKGVHVHKIEGDLFLKFVKPLNVSEHLNLWTNETKDKIYEFYKEDFIRFGYYYFKHL
jgi:hypothetical protein